MSTEDNLFTPEPSKFSHLKDKVIVLTGGANGIGAQLVQILHKAGAKLVFGDFDSTSGEKLASSLSSPDVTFLPTNVTKYDENYALFKTAFDKYGRVDHAIACAGIIEQGLWFDPNLTVESVSKPETTATLDVNLFGVLYFARIAVPFLKHGKKEVEDKSLTLFSSAAGFRESPGLPVYQCSKHGVQGLMRTLRRVIHPSTGIRINTLCPSVTETQMTKHVIDSVRDTGIVSSAEEVATITIEVLVRAGMNGQAVYVEGGKGYEIEKGLDRTMPQWLGEGPTERLRKGLRRVGAGAGWGVK